MKNTWTPSTGCGCVERCGEGQQGGMAWSGASGAGQRRDRLIATTRPKDIAISARNSTTWI